MRSAANSAGASEPGFSGADKDCGAAEDPLRHSNAARERAYYAGIVVILVAPFVVSAVRILMVKGGYATLSDLSIIELRIRDIPTHPPLVGPYSRFGWNHPGPALYYVLAVPYWLLGRASAGLAIGALAVNAASCVGVVALAHRRGGLRLAAPAAIAMLLFAHALGPATLANSWNPTLPVMPLVLFCMLTWSVSVGDALLMPVMVFVGSFIAQSHIGLVPVVLSLGAVACGSLAFRWHGRTARVSPMPLAVALGLFALMWSGPVVEAVAHHGGNLRALFHYFTHSHTAVGLSEAWRIVSNEFSASAQWLRGYARDVYTGEPASAYRATIPLGFALLALGSVYAVRRRERGAVEVMIIATLAAVVALLSIAAIGGVAYDYLSTWVSAVAVFGAIASVAVVSMASPWNKPYVERAVAALLVVAIIASSGFAVREALTFTDPSDRGAHIVADVANKLAALPSLRDRTVAIVNPADVVSAGAASGLFLGLERAGVRVRVPADAGYIYGAHRSSADLTHAVWLGVSVADEPNHVPSAKPGMQLLTRADGSSPEQLRRYERWRSEAERFYQQRRFAALKKLGPPPPAGWILTVWKFDDAQHASASALQVG